MQKPGSQHVIGNKNDTYSTGIPYGASLNPGLPLPRQLPANRQGWQMAQVLGLCTYLGDPEETSGSLRWRAPGLALVAN